MESDLLLFRARPLWQNQFWRVERQEESRDSSAGKSEAVKAMSKIFCPRKQTKTPAGISLRITGHQESSAHQGVVGVSPPSLSVNLSAVGMQTTVRPLVETTPVGPGWRKAENGRRQIGSSDTTDAVPTRESTVEGGPATTVTCWSWLRSSRSKRSEQVRPDKRSDQDAADVCSDCASFYRRAERNICATFAFLCNRATFAMERNFRATLAHFRFFWRW